MLKRLLALATLTALALVVAPALMGFGVALGVFIAWLGRGLGKT